MVLFLGLAPNLNLKVDNLSDSYHIVSHVSLAGEVIRLNCASVDIDHEVISLVFILIQKILSSDESRIEVDVLICHTRHTSSQAYTR
jgi:hypothetical protein